MRFARTYANAVLIASLVALCAAPAAFARARASGYCQQGGQTIQVLGYVSSTATPVQASYTGTGCNVLVLYSNNNSGTSTGPSGLVTTSGTAVTWAGSGNPFNANGQWSGLGITINGTGYTISSCSSSTACTITSSAGTQATPVSYSMATSAPAAVFSDNAGTIKSNPFSVSSTGYWFYYADNGSYANQYSGTAIAVTFTNPALPLIDPASVPYLPPVYLPSTGVFGTDCTNAAALNKTVIISSVENVLSAGPFACNIAFFPGGLLRIAASTNASFTGIWTAQPGQQTIDATTNSGATATFAPGSISVLPLAWLGITTGASSGGLPDNTAALVAADLIVQNSQGAFPIQFPGGIVAVNSHIILPNDGTGGGTDPYSHQQPIAWTCGSPSVQNGETAPPSASFHGCALEDTYAGSGGTGPLDDSVIAAQGSGYAVNDTGTIGGTCSGSAYKILAVETAAVSITFPRSFTIPLGAVTQYQITSAGSGCTVSDNVAASTGGSQPGSGTGFRISIVNTGGAVAKIETYGIGKFTKTGITLWDPSSDPLPFVSTTGTTLDFEHGACTGNGSGAGNTQDCYVMGGPKALFSSLNDPLASFQGYASLVSDEYFSGIRRAVMEKTFAGSNYYEHNHISQSVGTNLGTSGVFQKFPTNPNGEGSGSTFIGNRCEMLFQPYCYQFWNTSGVFIYGGDSQDATVGTAAIAFVGFFGSSQFSSVYGVNAIGEQPFIEDSVATGKNSVCGTYNFNCVLPIGVQSNVVTATAGNSNSTGAVFELNPTTATSGLNPANGQGYFLGQKFWNGSNGNNYDCLNTISAPGSGANPVITYIIQRVGCLSSTQSSSLGILTIDPASFSVLNTPPISATGAITASDVVQGKTVTATSATAPNITSIYTGAGSCANTSLIHVQIAVEAAFYSTCNAPMFMGTNNSFYVGLFPSRALHIGPDYNSDPGAGTVMADTAWALNSGTATTVAGLPACGAGTLGYRREVADANSATPGTTAAGSGNYTIAVQCIYNAGGTTYTWIID